MKLRPNADGSRLRARVFPSGAIEVNKVSCWIKPGSLAHLPQLPPIFDEKEGELPEKLS